MSASAAQPVSTKGLLSILGGTLILLLASFTSWGLTHRAAEPDRLSPSAAASNAAPAAARYTPKNVVVTQGPAQGELLVSWTMPVRPDVVATVIYQGAGAKARAVVTYRTGAKAVPQATVRGLASGQQVCLSAAHLVSLHDVVTNAPSRPVCAVPR